MTVALQMAKLVPAAPAEPLPFVRLDAVLYVWSPMDEDNLTARLKWAIDWLRLAGYLVGDSPAHLRLGTVRQVVERHSRRLDIELNAESRS